MNIQELILIGYEQQSCNNEGLVDAGDAMRIYSERTGYVFTEIEMENIEKSFEMEFNND